MRPIVLLIHGTFAHPGERQSAEPRMASSGRGKRWWEAGSTAWTSFRKALGAENLALAGDEEWLGAEPGNWDANGALKSHLQPFSWSSANTERARHQAGQQLLERLLEYEEEGRDYHLIGHSHGGSVIWLALQKAILYRWRRSGPKSELCRLRHLRSWATVGTAFLHYEGTKVGTWYGKALTIISLLLCLGFGAWIIRERLHDWQNGDSAIAEVIAKLQPGPVEDPEAPPHREGMTPFE